VAAVGYGVLTFVSSIFGDLIESVMKRDAGMKVRERVRCGLPEVRLTGHEGEARAEGRLADSADVAADGGAWRWQPPGCTAHALAAVAVGVRRAPLALLTPPHEALLTGPPTCLSTHQSGGLTSRSSLAQSPPRTLATSSPATADCWTALIPTSSQRPWPGLTSLWSCRASDWHRLLWTVPWGSGLGRGPLDCPGPILAALGPSGLSATHLARSLAGHGSALDLPAVWSADGKLQHRRGRPTCRQALGIM
jgi:hypothetical protein